MENGVTTELPNPLQKLIKSIARTFYSIEDLLIVENIMLNVCVSEDRICELLKFDKKMFRQRVNILKTDRFIQTKVKMVTSEDGKSSQKENYYYINYKGFVNIIKYKLDNIRKKLEAKERDQTARASFVCHFCQRNYTDLEADQLLDMNTGQLVCFICRREVQEDADNGRANDSRFLLTAFNEQMEPAFSLLKEVESIKLSQEFSDPTPQEYSDGKRVIAQRSKTAEPGKAWSGEATKRQGFAVEGTIDVNVDAEDASEEAPKTKEQPAWLSADNSFIKVNLDEAEKDTPSPLAPPTAPAPKKDVPVHDVDDVMSLLQAHEPKGTKRAAEEDFDIKEEPVAKKTGILEPFTFNEESLDGMLSDSSDDAGDVPSVTVGGASVRLTDVDAAVLARMTQSEKNAYITAYQEYNAGMDD